MTLVRIALLALLAGLGTAWPALPTLQALTFHREAAMSRAHSLSVAIGFNVCVDKVARLLQVFQRLSHHAMEANGETTDLMTATHEELAEAADRRRSQLPTPVVEGTIDSLPSLVALAETFLSHGAAAERVMADEAGFRALLQSANEPEAKAHDRLGGNAALMGLELARRGARVLLGGRIGKETEMLLNGTMQLLSPALEDGDDTHLILEYSRREILRGAEAPRANRLIITMDAGLANVEPLINLVRTVRGRNVDALVVAGLHMLEQLPQDNWRGQLQRLQAELSLVSSDVAVHVELASVASRSFLEAMVSLVLAHADSVGLNEQELADLYEAVGGEYGTPVEPAVTSRQALTGAKGGVMPSSSAVVAAARFVMKRVHSVSRVHVHTLGFQAVLQGASPHPSRHGPRLAWSSPVDAAVSASVTATERACGSDASGMTEEMLELRVDPTVLVHDEAVSVALQTASEKVEMERAGSLTEHTSAESRQLAWIWTMGQPKHVDLSHENPVAQFFVPRHPQAAARNADNAAKSRRFQQLLQQGVALQQAYETALGGSSPGTVQVLSPGDEPFPLDHEGQVLLHVAVTPVAVCREPRSTVGLGDAVSASGLAAHLFPKRQAHGEAQHGNL
jgi:ADP-dependent phosphofructokinase/glucokinase